METLEFMAWCGSCAVRAAAQERMPTELRDLACFGSRFGSQVWSKATVALPDRRVPQEDVHGDQRARHAAVDRSSRRPEAPQLLTRGDRPQRGNPCACLSSDPHRRHCYRVDVPRQCSSRIAGTKVEDQHATTGALTQSIRERIADIALMRTGCGGEAARYGTSVSVTWLRA